SFGTGSRPSTPSGYEGRVASYSSAARSKLRAGSITGSSVLRSSLGSCSSAQGGFRLAPFPTHGGDEGMKDRKSLVAVVLVAIIGVVATGTSSARTTSHRGGTLKLLAKAAGGTLDPQVNYTLQYWQLYQATYDGLLGFKKAGGSEAFKVVPDLASGYKISNAGKTWTFTLRKGIKFSNGQTVTVNDVVASLRRIF